jgi:hypothetical protein
MWLGIQLLSRDWFRLWIIEFREISTAALQGALTATCLYRVCSLFLLTI